MIGDIETFELTTEDDNLHEPTSDHPWWTETFWLSFALPERRMHVCIYPWFRRNLGLQAGGVLIWDDTAEVPWDMVFCEYDFHLPLAPDLDLRHAKLPNGLTLECLETQQRYRARYDHDEVTIDVTFDGLMSPLVSGRDGVPNHLDQSGRMVGEIVLRGERIPVDTVAMRDRSWSVRLGAARVGYAWGTTPSDTSFLAVTIIADGAEKVCDGYLLHEGEAARLEDGERRTTRAAGRPDQLSIDAVDALGRSLHAEGRCVSRIGFNAYPGTFSWDSAVQWSVNGVAAYGEDQDVWTTTEWRQAQIDGRRP